MKSATFAADVSSAPERSLFAAEADLSAADLAVLNRELDPYVAFWAEAREEAPIPP